jgi:hypothetical protein
LAWFLQAARQASRVASSITRRESGKEKKTHMVELRERAQGLVEYGLIIALVAVLAIAGLIIFGPAISSLLSRLGGSV